MKRTLNKGLNNNTLLSAPRKSVLDCDLVFFPASCNRDTGATRRIGWFYDEGAFKPQSSLKRLFLRGEPFRDRTRQPHFSSKFLKAIFAMKYGRNLKRVMADKTQLRSYRRCSKSAVVIAALA